MPLPRPDETVRLMFEARNAGDLRGACALMHPDIEARWVLGSVIRGIDAVRTWFAGDGARQTEVHAHRIEADGEDVVAYGRIRFLEDGALADSPAAWRFRVQDGVVLSIVPMRP